ncbi:hypothetical protein PVL29_013075 [Vitis rotundifolia]|uniref:DUF1685 family protein n=1 Tax=Vitis rotundifolia TaxID=103349 RepID=A0AA38ZKI1_VITRO|nr:hypothetical protein PVL29_013075 [Vitis rotundifolia]
MDAEEVLKLFDSCWFNLEIFKEQPSSSSSMANTDQQIQEEPSKPVLSRSQTRHIRSISDQLSYATSFNPGSFSPDTVLEPKLQPIPSGKEIREEENSTETRAGKASSKRVALAGGRRRTKGMSKSLSDLEFDELKGFIDLGFVFSEEDKDSSLVSIIPGLHRLGKKDGEEENTVDESAIPRPYLSEAWEVFDRRKKENPSINWRVPALSSETDMKDSLRSWAHTVASSVR